MGMDIAKQSEMISTILERMAYLEAFLTGESEILCNKEEVKERKVNGLTDILRENNQKIDLCYKNFDRLEKIIRGE